MDTIIINHDIMKMHNPTFRFQAAWQSSYNTWFIYYYCQFEFRLGRENYLRRSLSCIETSMTLGSFRFYTDARLLRLTGKNLPCWDVGSAARWKMASSDLIGFVYWKSKSQKSKRRSETIELKSLWLWLVFRP